MTGKLKAFFSFSRTQHYSSRQGFIKWLFLLIFCGFGYRIITIHQLDTGNMSLQEKGNEQASNTFKFEAHRGDILGRKGSVLASNLIFSNVNLDPTILQKEFIPKLAKALDMPEKELRATINKKLSKKQGRRNLLIKKDVSLTSPIFKNLKKLKKLKLKVCESKDKKVKPPLYDRLLIAINLKTDTLKYITVKKCWNKKISGMALQTDGRRYYPKSASLAPLLGRVNYSGYGASGVEGAFESTLAGTDGVKTLSHHSNSKKSYFNPIVRKKLRHGQNISLTIDADIQYHAYTAIKKSVKKHEADSGAAIILNPQGEILALVNYPADDPNNKTTYHAENYRNRVLSDKVDAGSTIKPFTMLLALDKGKITATNDELIDVSKRIGHLKPDGKYSHMTVKKILQKSHNLGTVNVSERLTKEEMYDTWNKLGFGHALNLIPNIETPGLLKPPSSWSKSDKRTLSYGYGPMQTNLAQLARAYLVFANDGAILPLRLVKDASIYGQKVQVFSKKSTRKIAHLLDAVASQEGSGYRAQIKGYTVAGKTGTAEMVVNGKYNKDGAKRTFFAGFTPVKNPKYIMVVRLDYPKKCYASWDPKIKISCEGSNSAAMVFKDTMQPILNGDESIKLLTKK